MFLDANKNIISSLSSGLTFHDQLILPLTDTILNFNTDAGFIIPTNNNGLNKYIRISDIYNKVNDKLNKPQINDLADRLHAVELSAITHSSDVLESNDPEAEHLRNIKSHYSVLDISNL